MQKMRLRNQVTRNQGMPDLLQSSVLGHREGQRLRLGIFSLPRGLWELGRAQEGQQTGRGWRGLT